jgi:hypothetical protein
LDSCQTAGEKPDLGATTQASLQQLKDLENHLRGDFTKDSDFAAFIFLRWL